MKDELNRSHNDGGVVYLLQSELSYSTGQYTKSKNWETFLYTKIQILCKKQGNLCNFFYSKIKKVYVTQFFIKYFNLSFIYKKHDTLQYLRVYIQRARQFAKNKTICVSFYLQKSGHFALRNFSLNF